jgi:hypothetical protein
VSLRGAAACQAISHVARGRVSLIKKFPIFEDTILSWLGQNSQKRQGIAESGYEQPTSPLEMKGMDEQLGEEWQEVTCGNPLQSVWEAGLSRIRQKEKNGDVGGVTRSRRRRDSSWEHHAALEVPSWSSRQNKNEFLLSPQSARARVQKQQTMRVFVALFAGLLTHLGISVT